MWQKFVMGLVGGIFIAGVLSILDTEAAKRSQGRLEHQEPLYQSHPSDYFTDAQIDRGKRYHLTRYWLFFLKTGVIVSALIFFLGVGGHEIVEGIALWITGGRHVPAIALASVMLVVQLWILTFPFTVYGGYVHEKAYGLLTQGFSGWLLDYLKERVVNVALLLPVSIGLFVVVRRFPSTWWLFAGGGSGILLTVFVFLAPVIIDPLFYTFTPIENTAVRNILFKMADRAGLDVNNVLEMNASTKMSRVNAYVTGLGRTKRIVVYDTLIHESTPEEVGVVFAHELGHVRRRHLWKGITLGVVGSFIAFFCIALLLRAITARGVFGLSTPASFGGVVVIFFAMLLLDLVSLPLQTFVSRRFEREADRESLILTGDSKTFIKVEKRLAVKNLADVQPHPVLVWVFYTHPPVMERIRMAEAYERSLEQRTGEEEDKKMRGKKQGTRGKKREQGN
jgi:STE24 endopeptidase